MYAGNTAQTFKKSLDHHTISELLYATLNQNSVPLQVTGDSMQTP